MYKRQGLYVDESPVSSDYLNPETPSMTKVSYTAGLSFRPRKFVSIDVAYCYVSSADPERMGSYPIYSYQDNTKLESIFSGNYKPVSYTHLKRMFGKFLLTLSDTVRISRRRML